MPRPSEAADAAAWPSRRVLLGAAWALPVVALAVAAPAAAATVPMPKVVVFPSKTSLPTNIFLAVSTIGASGSGEARYFVTQGRATPTSPWVDIFGLQMTDSSGFAGFTVNVQGRDSLRIVASFGVYGSIASPTIQLPLP